MTCLARMRARPYLAAHIDEIIRVAKHAWWIHDHAVEYGNMEKVLRKVFLRKVLLRLHQINAVASFPFPGWVWCRDVNNDM